MPIFDGAALDRDAFEHSSWTVFQAMVFIAGGSVLLWGMVLSLVHWLI